MTLPRLLLAFALLAVTAGGVRADDAAADDAATRTAKRHFDRGEKFYAVTRFREALAEYQRAFDAKPIPDFLFNIGQCYRNLGEYDPAIFSFRKYLTLAPGAPNRAQVEQLIDNLETERDRNQSRRLGLAPPPSAAPRPAPAPEPEASPIYKRWWFWTGIAVVAAGGGVVAYAATRPAGPPSTSLGNIVFGK
jgi:tetratricopeptide (TPR) repeat protein